jgi:hypothetical protein
MTMAETIPASNKEMQSAYYAAAPLSTAGNADSSEYQDTRVLRASADYGRSVSNDYGPAPVVDAPSNSSAGNAYTAPPRFVLDY